MTLPEWLACQRGAASTAASHLEAEPRYIANYRALTEYVHRDFSFQAFLNAALIALQMGGKHGDAVLSPTNPYRGSRTQFGDITFGNKDLLSMLARASILAQKGILSEMAGASPFAVGERRAAACRRRRSGRLWPLSVHAPDQEERHPGREDRRSERDHQADVRAAHLTMSQKGIYCRRRVSRLCQRSGQAIAGPQV
jgi:hypothetical protein